MDTQKFIQNFKDAIGVEDDREILLTDKFRDYPEWSSLAFLSVLSMLDDEYNVIIDGKDFRRLETVQDVISATEKSMGDAV